MPSVTRAPTKQRLPKSRLGTRILRVSISLPDLTIAPVGIPSAQAFGRDINAGIEGLPNAIVENDNLTGVVTDLWDDPSSPDTIFLTANDVGAPATLRVSFPTPSTAPGSGGPVTFQIYIRRTTTQGADPTAIVELWEDGAFVRELTRVTITSTSGQLVSATIAPSDLTDSTGAGVEVRVRTEVDLTQRMDLLYGVEIGAWREDGNPAVNPSSGIPDVVTRAGLTTVRFAVHDTFSDLLDPLGTAGEVSRANFRNAVGGIINNLKAIPWLKMLPISLQAIETKTGERWVPPWTGTIPSVWLDTYKAVLTEVRNGVGYSGPIIIESHNEMHYNAWSVWRDRDGALDTSTGLPLTGAGNTGISKRIGEHWAQTMPELKRYCREVLGFSQVLVGGEVGVSGGSGWGQSITPNAGQPYGYLAGYQARWVDEFNTAIKTAYDAAPAYRKADYIPDFESIHAYPHSPDFTEETPIYQFDDNKAFAYYRQWIISSRARVNLIWGSTIGNNILFAMSEGNAGFSNDSGIWTGFQTAGQTESWFDGWFDMLRGDGNIRGSGTRYWANITFAIATDADGTGGTANTSSRYYNVIHFDGTTKSWFANIRQKSTTDPYR